MKMRFFLSRYFSASYWKIKFSSLIFLLITLIFLANILLAYLLLAGKLETEKTLLIKPNMALSEISLLLKEEGVIAHAKLFELISRLYSFYQPLKSGEYKFSKKISPAQILTTLAAGKSITHRLLVQEGSNAKQIIANLESNPLLAGKISGQVPEGYLMPSTYFYSYKDQRQKLLEEMKLAMSLALDQVMPNLTKDSPLKTRKDVLILASMIEKEAGYNDDRSRIAAVFINRLRKNMRLQSDPTAIFALTQGKFPFARKLTSQDLKIKSPYNTYYIYGLPKGAICCPSLASLQAATKPAASDELYFVANGRGGHNFAKNYKDHLKNINILRQLQKKRKK